MSLKLKNEEAEMGKEGLKETNKEGEKIQMNMSFIRASGYRGLSTEDWADEVVESSLVLAARVPAAEPGVGASQAQEQQPSPGSVCSKLPH